MKKSFRQSVTFPSEIKDDLDYLSEKLGKTRSTIIAEVVSESIPELANLVRTAAAAKGSPKADALSYAIKQMNSFLENTK